MARLTLRARGGRIPWRCQAVPQLLMRARMIAAPSSPIANKKDDAAQGARVLWWTCSGPSAQEGHPAAVLRKGLRPFLPEQRARIISRVRVMDWLLFILLFLAIGTVWNYRGETSLWCGRYPQSPAQRRTAPLFADRRSSTLLGLAPPGIVPLNS